MPQCSFSLSIGTPMELSKKVKIALDETRMLILGAQILLGFQFRGVFSDGYGQLPSHARYLDGVALGFHGLRCWITDYARSLPPNCRGRRGQRKFPPPGDGHC